MIFIGLYLVICALVIRLAEKSLERKLESAVDLDGALAIRRQIYARRRTITIVAIVLFVIYISFVNSFNLFSVGLGLFYFSLFHPYSNLRGNISTYEKDLFLRKHDSFVLYLRGFYTDNYGDAYSGYLKSIPIFNLVFRLLYKRQAFFHEKAFMKRLTLRKLPNPCAIGNPKEIDSPGGAIRVYLREDTWHEDVVEMMDHSRMVIVLVNSSPSCVLEIDHSMTMLEKTFFLITEPFLYEGVRSQIANSGSLPSIPVDMEAPCYLYFDEGLPVFRHFYNDENGCMDLGDEISKLYFAGPLSRKLNS